MLFHEMLSDRAKELQIKVIDCTLRAVKSLVKSGIPLETVEVAKKSNYGETRILGYKMETIEGEGVETLLKEVWWGYKIRIEWQEDSLQVVAEPYNPNE